jgi:hypothetical protein
MVILGMVVNGVDGKEESELHASHHRLSMHHMIE